MIYGARDSSHGATTVNPKVKHINSTMPMKFFTQEENKPSEITLHIIRQIAYTYRMDKAKGQDKSFVLN